MFSQSRQEVSTARILYRQFLFRIVELESLSSKADVIRLLGQLASVLVMISLIEMLGGLSFADAKMPAAMRETACWSMEYQLLSLTLLSAGLFSILSWEALLPDQRDVYVLGPLPVKPFTLCLAKVLASASAIGLSAFAINCASGLIWSMALAQTGFVPFLRSYIAYYLVMICAVLFLFSAVLVLQSAVALVLPRAAYLRISTFLQTVLFALMLVSFFGPAVPTPERLVQQCHTASLSWFPPYCFTALFFQIRGNLPSTVHMVAMHGWILLVGSLSAAAGCSTALYARLLSRIVSAPDIVQRRPWLTRAPWVKDSLQNALFFFIGRSFNRNKQQKLIFAFYSGIGTAVLFAVLEMANTKAYAVATSPSRIGLPFLVSTIVAMTVVVVGFRASFTFPVSLSANWVFRLHQIQAPSAYFRASRHALVVFTVIPVCVVSTICGLIFEPAVASLEHIVFLVLYGILLADICLYGNLKLPYTCSYLPGSAQLPFLFWGSVALFIPMTDAWAHVEQRFLYSLPAFGAVLVFLTLSVCLLEWRNRALSANADVCFDEVPEEIVVRLGLGGS